jgi:hypothetical protein
MKRLKWALAPIIAALFLIGCKQDKPENTAPLSAQAPPPPPTQKVEDVHDISNTPDTQNDDYSEFDEEGWTPIDIHPIEVKLRERLKEENKDPDYVPKAFTEARDAWYEEIKQIQNEIIASMLNTPEERELMEKNCRAWEDLWKSEEALIKKILHSVAGDKTITQQTERSYSIQRERAEKIYSLFFMLKLRKDGFKDVQGD